MEHYAKIIERFNLLDHDNNWHMHLHSGKSINTKEPSSSLNKSGPPQPNDTPYTLGITTIKAFTSDAVNTSIEQPVIMSTSFIGQQINMGIYNIMNQFSQ